MASTEMPSVPSTDVEQWTLTEVCGWLSANGFPHDVEERFREHEVTGDVLLSLSEEDLGKLGIKFGLCRRLSLRVSKLRGGAPAGCSQQSINNACEPLSKGELRTSIQSGQPNKRVLRPSHSAPASFKSQRVKQNHARVRSHDEVHMSMLEGQCVTFGNCDLSKKKKHVLKAMLQRPPASYDDTIVPKLGRNAGKRIPKVTLHVEDEDGAVSTIVLAFTGAVELATTLKASHTYIFTEVDAQSVDPKYCACGVSFTAWDGGYIVSVPEGMRIASNEKVLESISMLDKTAQGSIVTVLGVVSNVHPEETRAGIPSRQVTILACADAPLRPDKSRACIDIILWRNAVTDITDDMSGSCVTLHNFAVHEFGNRTQLSTSKASWVSVSDDLEKESVVELRSVTTTYVEASSTFFIDARQAKPLPHWLTQQVGENIPYVVRCNIAIINVHTFMACPDCNRKRVDSILRDAGACPECQSQRAAIIKSFCDVRLTQDGETMDGKCFGQACTALSKLVKGAQQSADVFATIKVELMGNSEVPHCTVERVMRQS